MINFALDEESSTGTLTLSGDLGIQHASALKESLLEGISHAEKLVFNLEEVERIDLSTVQLLCAAHREIMKNKLTLVIAGAIPAAVRETIVESGYAHCLGDGDTSELWSEENS